MAERRRRRRRRVRKDPMLTRKFNRIMREKLVAMLCIVVLAFTGLALYVTYINASNGEAYSKTVLTQSQQQYTSTTIPFKRGDILDTNGTTLATSEKVYNLILDCAAVNENNETNKSIDYTTPTVNALVQFFNLDADEVRNKIESEDTKSSRYQILLEGVTIEEKKAFENYCEPDDEEKADLSDEELDERSYVTGVWFEEDYIRNYPFGSLACDVLGFTYDGTTADYGIEGYYNSMLNGVNGRQYGYVTENDTTEQTIIDATDGNTLVTTLDSNIQQIVEEKLSLMWDGLCGGPDGDIGAAHIGVIVENPNTGEILAMANSQPYDLNDPRDLTAFYSEEEINQMDNDTMLENLQEIWANYCISDAFEPGSTFKPVTVSSCLDAGVVSENDYFECDGFMKFGANDMIKCAVYPSAHGSLNVSDALMVSCNDVMMQISKKLGATKFLEYQKRFGFGARTGIDLPSEAAGTLFTEDSLGAMELAASSFGQGFTCTMLQLCNSFCSAINGGYLYQPHVVKQILNSNGAVVETKDPVVLRQTCSTEVSEEVRSYLGTVTSASGSGKYAKLNGYSMGGKTGTAQKLSAGDGKYLVSFIGFAPLDDPQVVVYVVMDEPNLESQADSKYPQYLCKSILSELLPYMNIFSDEGDTALPDSVYEFDDKMERLFSKVYEARGYTQDENGDWVLTQDEESTDVDVSEYNTDDEDAAYANDPEEEVDNEDLPETPEDDSEESTEMNTVETGGITNEEWGLIN